MNNYYKILQVDKDASPEVIKVAYKLLVKKNHPDLKEGKEKKEAEDKIKEINEAYDILSNPTKKAEYDQTLISDSISVEQYQSVLNENQNLKKELNYLKNGYNKSYTRTNYAKTQYTNMYDNNINFNKQYNQNNSTDSNNTNSNYSNNLNAFNNLNESIKNLIAIIITFLIIFVIIKIPLLHDLLLNIFGGGTLLIIIIVIAFYYYFFRNKQ